MENEQPRTLADLETELVACIARREGLEYCFSPDIFTRRNIEYLENHETVLRQQIAVLKPKEEAGPRVSVHLHADTRLSPETREALGVMVRCAVDAAERGELK